VSDEGSDLPEPIEEDPKVDNAATRLALLRYVLIERINGCGAPVCFTCITLKKIVEILDGKRTNLD
jgi:hypothetical protein